MDASGQARMQDFSANKAVIDVNNKSLPGGWLVYADAFHPGWKAFIDGQQVKIEKAYLAFKAVYVPFGHHVVKFVFYDPLGTPASILMSAWGCLGAMGLLWLLFIGLTDNFLVVKAEKNIRIEAGRI